MTDLSTTFQPIGRQMPFGWEYEPGWSHAAAWGKMLAGQIVMANKRLDNGGLALVAKLAQPAFPGHGWAPCQPGTCDRCGRDHDKRNCTTPFWGDK